MSYDVFLSHNHADKGFTRRLHDALSRTDHNGRNLRAWLDERVLDPGLPSSDRELHAAIDRARFLVVVLSPESMASPWVRNEIEYFLRHRRGEEAIVIRRRPVEVPAGLEVAPLIEWPGPPDAEDRDGGAGADGEADDDADGEEAVMAQLLDLARPGPRLDEYGTRQALRRVWRDAMWSHPEGFDPDLAPRAVAANSRLVEEVLRPAIADPDTEGEALVAFDTVGFHLSDIDGARFYSAKMVVGELLALAIARDHRYRRVATRFIAQEEASIRRPSLLQRRNRAANPRVHVGPTTNLTFAVARAASKLAEMDPAAIDLSTLWAVLHSLDRRVVGDDGARRELTDDEAALVVLVGRALGKLRSTGSVDVLVATLARWGGPASRRAAGTAIAATFDDASDPVVTLLPELAAAAGAVEPMSIRPPSPLLVELLLDGPLRDPLDPHLARCHDDLVAAHGDDGTVGPGRPPGSLAFGPVADRVIDGPLAGRARLVTLADMEQRAETLRPGDLACLTEPRIVDTLLDRAGGFVLRSQDEDSPLCIRLRNRNQRFAVLDDAQFDRIEEGGHLTFPAGDGAGRSMGLALPPEPR